MCFGITPLNACRCFTNICFVPLVIFIVAHAILLFSRFFLGRLFMFDIWFGSWSIRLMNKSSVEQQQLINQLFNAHVTWMIFILWYLHRQARNGFEKPKHIEWTWTNEHKFINFKSEIKIYILRRNKICVVVCLYDIWFFGSSNKLKMWDSFRIGGVIFVVCSNDRPNHNSNILMFGWRSFRFDLCIDVCDFFFACFVQIFLIPFMFLRLFQ